MMGGFSPLGRFAIVSAAVAVVALFLRAASSFIAPILLAVFVTIIMAPVLDWMRRRGLPKWGAVAVIAFILLDIGSIIVLVGTGAVESFRDTLPTFQERITILTDDLETWLKSIGLAGSDVAVPDILDGRMLTIVTRTVVSNISGSLGTALLVLLLVVFMLAETGSLRAKVRAAFGLSDVHEQRLIRLLRGVNHYVMIKVLTSLAIAFCVWLLLLFMGIDFAILWAILAFFLNFIPFIGNILMMIPAILVAVVQYDVQAAIIVAIGYVAVNGIIGNVIEPRVMGRGLGMSTVAVFVSLMFWGWIFGAVGVFLSVPLTMAIIALMEAHPTSRPVAILLGSPPGPLDHDLADEIEGDATAEAAEHRPLT